MSRFRPEILAPAGDFSVFLTAIKYRADAVYLGGKELNLRAKAEGFSWEELQKAISIAKEKKVKVYFCLNVFPKEKHIPKIEETLNRLKEIKISGIIISDPGVIDLAKQIAPEIPIHLSTQANTTNSLSVNFWKKIGVKRINLARELSLLEIYKIRKKHKDIELEVFVHGAMCLSYSGRCLLSEYLNKRHANLGLCTQPCRYQYKIIEAYLEEKTRPGKKLWRVIEEKEFSKILSCEDLCLVRFLNWFVKNKINALKIEGRTKTSSYVGPVVDVYKSAVESILNKKKFDYKVCLAELLKTTSRDFSTGFFLYPKKIELPINEETKKYPVLAQVISKIKEDKWLVEVKHRWFTKDSFEILIPGLKRFLVKSKEYKLENQEGLNVDVLHSGQKGFLRCETPYLEEYILLRKF